MGEPHVAMGEWEGEFKRQMDPNKEESRLRGNGVWPGKTME